MVAYTWIRKYVRLNQPNSLNVSYISTCFVSGKNINKRRSILVLHPMDTAKFIGKFPVLINIDIIHQMTHTGIRACPPD